MRMRSPRGRGTLVLVGAWHVGAPAYYDALAAALADADVVFSETLRPPSDTAGGPAAVPADLRRIHAYQAAVADLLGLRRQAAWTASVLDDRWRALDLPYAAQDEALGGRSLLDARQRDRIAQVEAWARGEGDPAELAAARAALRDGMLAAAAAPPRAPDRWQRARDDAMLAVLRRALDDDPARRIALVCGPAHLRAIAPRLRAERGWRVTAVAWHDVLE